MLAKIALLGIHNTIGVLQFIMAGEIMERTMDCGPGSNYLYISAHTSYVLRLLEERMEANYYSQHTRQSSIPLSLALY